MTRRNTIHHIIQDVILFLVIPNDVNVTNKLRYAVITF